MVVYTVIRCGRPAAMDDHYFLSFFLVTWTSYKTPTFAEVSDVKPRLFFSVLSNEGSEVKRK